MPARDHARRLRIKLGSYSVVATVTTVENMLIIANPGFQSHDEWQIYDFVRKYGLPFFLHAYVRVYPGSDFGTPVRPIGFLQEGLLTFWMQSAPVVLHMFSVALQASTALVFARVLTSAGVNPSRAAAAAILFGISPLAAFATGWTAACFDQWYSLFALLAAWAVIAITNHGFNLVRIVSLAGCSALAILSKETAAVLPAGAAGLVVALCLLRGSVVPWQRAIQTGMVAAVPVMCYLAIRFPAILATLHVQHGPYSPSPYFALGNALMYFAYPALALTGEIPSAKLVHFWPLLAASMVHLLLVLAVLRRFGWLAASTYLAGYFIFLLPVLTLPSLGAHYLYASGYAMALALGCLLLDAEGRFRIRVLPLAATSCVALLTLHSLHTQRELYANGRCQHDFLLSIDLRMAETTGPIVIRPEPGVPWWNGVRAVFGRVLYERVTVTDPASTVPANERMDWSCRARPMS